MAEESSLRPLITTESLGLAIIYPGDMVMGEVSVFIIEVNGSCLLSRCGTPSSLLWPLHNPSLLIHTGEFLGTLSLLLLKHFIQKVPSLCEPSRWSLTEHSTFLHLINVLEDRARCKTTLCYLLMICEVIFFSQQKTLSVTHSQGCTFLV